MTKNEESLRYMVPISFWHILTLADLTYSCSLFDFIKAKFLSFVEHQQDQSLKQGHLKFLLLLKHKYKQAL